MGLSELSNISLYALLTNSIATMDDSINLYLTCMKLLEYYSAAQACLLLLCATYNVMYLPAGVLFKLLPLTLQFISIGLLLIIATHILA